MLARIVFQRLRRTSKSVLLLGPRQVGKSTLCRSLNPDLILNLADETAFLMYSKEPGRIQREIQALEKPSLILIDEIQRVPALLNSVQAALDAGSRHRFLLTGSSARKLRRRGVNLLPGRVLLEYLDPLSIWELGPLLDLEKALRFGTLPVVCLDPAEGPQVLESYVNVYLREEIRQEALTRNIGAYARFLDIAAEASGDWINYSKLSSDAEIPKETLRRFYQLLEETLLAFRVPPFRPKESRRRLSRRDRFIFFDVGVRNALLGLHRRALSRSESGKLFEQWMLLQCLYFIRARRKPWRISSYRTDAGAEVDFVIDTGDRLLAVECKYGRDVGESQMKGLRSFEAVAHKPVAKFVVYQGGMKQRFSKGELAVPYEEFLLKVIPGI